MASQTKTGTTIADGRWSEEEDATIKRLVEREGIKKWSVVSKHLKDRSGKQCRERWYNHLAPGINRSEWTDDEDRVIIQLHKDQGCCWSVMSKALPGRTDNAIKNRWNSTLRKTKRQDMYSKEEKKAGRRCKEGGILYHYICSTLSADSTSATATPTPLRSKPQKPSTITTPSPCVTSSTTSTRKRKRDVSTLLVDTCKIPALPTSLNSPMMLNPSMVDIDSPLSPASSVDSRLSDDSDNNNNNKCNNLTTEQVLQLKFMLSDRERALLDHPLQGLYQLNHLMYVC